MKLDKEKILSKVNNITTETKKFTADITKKTKIMTLDTKKRITAKLENIESNHIITQEDIVKILDGIYDSVLNGLGKASPSVEDFSKNYLVKEKEPSIAAKKMINNQIVKCTTSGFIAGFGGLITLPITIPANISSVLYVQMRMIACTAYMAGYDLKSDQVQTLVYACLAGISVSEVVKQTGVKIGVKMATSAIKKIPGKTLTKINQKVGFRFVTKFGEKGVINLGKLVPGVGAVIGSSLDYVETKVIANRAYDWFFEGEFEKDETETSKNYVKQLQWDMAIGLQKVDNLKPSKYLEKLLQENVTGKKTIYEVEHELKQHYVKKDKTDKKIQEEFECDLVSTRIVQLLEKDNFELSVDYIKYIHEYLFKDVYEFAGEFRKVDFSKHERILNNDSVAYGDCKLLEQSLDYDISKELNKNYNEMNIVDVINDITNFSSSIWQIHPFREGNTRTTALFIEKYLVSLGYDVDNTMFKEKSVYYRNALVRSNYFNNYLNIKQDNNFLIKFYENLLLGKNNNLNSRDLIVVELFNKEN